MSATVRGQCAVPLCWTVISPTQVMCRHHWSLVPEQLRQKIEQSITQIERGVDPRGLSYQLLIKQATDQLTPKFKQPANHADERE